MTATKPNNSQEKTPIAVWPKLVDHKKSLVQRGTKMVA